MLDAEALHEAVADHGRVARGLDLAGLVVDLGGEQDRAAAVEARARSAHRNAPRRAIQKLSAMPAPRAIPTISVGRLRRGRLLAGDLIEAVVHDEDGEVARLHHADGGEAAERHQDRAVALERDHAALGLRQRDAERDRAGEAHAAEHVEILRPVAGRVEIEIGVADAADHRLLARELCDQAFGEVGAVPHLAGVLVRAWRSRRPRVRL